MSPFNHMVLIACRAFLTHSCWQAARSSVAGSCGGPEDDLLESVVCNQ